MAVETDDLYSNLQKLLDDICKFLSDEANYQKLSPNSRKQANELLSRSKKHLQDISKITAENEYQGAYVDMERKSGKNEEDEDDIYACVEETNVKTPQPINEPQPNPYATLPAKDLNQNMKYGVLSWKCKIILKFEKIKRIYAGVHNNWLLIYSSEKDMKPLQTFNLKFHKAQEVSSKQNKNPPQDFELVSTAGERKSYYFLALTHKDMLQWTTHINRCYECLNKSEEPTASEESLSETYDMITDLNNLEDEPDLEDEYQDIEMYSKQTNTPVKPPDLPARRCINSKANTPLPSIPQAENYNQSNNSLSDEDTHSSISEESEKSFSSSDSDNIYEPFVSPTTISQVPNNRPASPSIYENNTSRTIDTNIERAKTPPASPSIYENNSSPTIKTNTEKPKMPAKPKILPPKPKQMSIRRK